MPDEVDVRSNRLLVVDDEPLVCSLLQDVARSAGWRAVCASRPADIEQRASERYDAALVDVHLGPVDLQDVLVRIAVHSPGCAVVLMTGSAEHEATVAAVRAGRGGVRVVGSLHKPVRLGALTELLEELAADQPVA